MFRALASICFIALVWTCGNPPIVAVPEEDAGTVGTRDAGLIIDTDAGPADAGVVFPTDSGVIIDVDAGPHFVDAGIDAGFDAGVDAGPPPVLDAGTFVRFVAIGDTGKGNAGQNQVGGAIGTLCAAQGCDFVVMLGDNFYPSGVSSVTDPQWQTAFVQPYATVNAPFYAVLGNHDYGGDGAGTDLPKGDNEVAYSQVNPKWRMPDNHYKFAFGNAEFFAADTNRSMFSVDQSVRSDFDTWLPASTAQWKIALGHHPLKSNGEHGNAGSYDGLPFVPVANGSGVKKFIEERVCGRADVYLCGHDHSIQWLKPTCTRSGSNINTELILSGGAAATTPLSGSNQAWYQSDQLGFVYIVIHDKTFTATFYDAMGAVKYTRTITKP